MKRGTRFGDDAISFGKLNSLVKNGFVVSLATRMVFQRAPTAAKRFAEGVCSHGGIENRLRWQLDVTIGADHQCCGGRP
jgi:hypothetical protein